MNVTTVGFNKDIVYIESETPIMVDVQSAIDLMATVHYEHGCNRMIVHKSAINEEFFELRTRLAGDILQKYTNYQMKLAIIGDFYLYTSKALRDFIYESNNGRDIFFLETVDAAIAKFGG